MNHYKHEVDTDPKEALTLRPQTLNHLHIIEQRVQQAIDMLNRVPQLQKKILAQIGEYMQLQWRIMDMAQQEFNLSSWDD